jgi:hypothetical protein
MYMLVILIILIIVYFYLIYNTYYTVEGGGTSTNRKISSKKIIPKANTLIKRDKPKFNVSTEVKQFKVQGKLKKADLLSVNKCDDNYMPDLQLFIKFAGFIFNKDEISKFTYMNDNHKIEKYINFADIYGGLKYRTNKHVEKKEPDLYKKMTNVHKGQRKLFLSEVLFLTKLYDLKFIDESKKYILVYVGAGPGHHLIDIIKLFPKFTYHLYDTRFDSGLDVFDNVKLHLQFFNDSTCDRYIGENVIFISDIRHPSMSDFNEPSAAQNPIIIRDQKMQEVWVRKILPVATMLKFRLPWLDNEAPYKYLDGEIYTQAYAPPNSTESRLIILDPTSTRKWSCNEYENKFFYINKVVRLSYKFGSTMNYDNAYIHWICDYFNRIASNGKFSPNFKTIPVLEIAKKYNKSMVE